ncbi:D-glycero-alpha-D-manno-heptose-1,7-bisphosphate 7-phosphatase [Alkalibacterium olivapovliticus]|uniref:D,D-heptose 1,7-bisphosphate phosphatase n=1 Tax=Alkalibacterium olivapovliticus TaxID=99907 RepID=A0A2T0WA67_9LACT|nr:HAD-IIIA family hydrolase [Alkalibacterium olivapovliticus]PRY83601.1 D-glycero-D-manno-heptose 1,7-bisphosphate phosphatase [Alkalibacterium olivapovliticus]
MTKAVFWDLLGTLGGTSQTLIPDFTFYDEALPALKTVHNLGFINIIITNQSHIAHGRVTMKEFDESCERLMDESTKEEVEIKAIYVCPHQRKDNCSCKKPKPELVFRAQNEFDINLKSSFVVGDSVKNDMGLAQAIGAKGILVLTGEGKEGMGTTKNISPDSIAENLTDAVDFIKNNVLHSFEQ